MYFIITHCPGSEPCIEFGNVGMVGAVEIEDFVLRCMMADKLVDQEKHGFTGIRFGVSSGK